MDNEMETGDWGLIGGSPEINTDANTFLSFWYSSTPSELRGGIMNTCAMSSQDGEDRP